MATNPNNIPNPQHHPFALEPLEPRCFLSVTLDPAGLLTIDGTDAADAIKLRPGHEPGSVIVKSSIPGDNDTYTDVTELVILGGDGNDKIKLNGLLTGTDGGPLAITIDGGDGHDRIKASQGPDTVIGGPGDDRINARNGDDTVMAGEGNDRINGGKGNDHISYESAPAPVVVNLQKSSATDDGYGHRDKLRGFEHLLGSLYEDRITNHKRKPVTITGGEAFEFVVDSIGLIPKTTQTVIIGRTSDALGQPHRLTLVHDDDTGSSLDITDTIDDDGLFAVEQDQIESLIGTKLETGATYYVDLLAEDIAGNLTEMLIPVTKGIEYELTLPAASTPDPDTPDTPTPGFPLPDGTYDITATATDIAGNTSEPSNTETITVDTQNPVLEAGVVDVPTPIGGTSYGTLTGVTHTVFGVPAGAGLNLSSLNFGSSGAYFTTGLYGTHGGATLNISNGAIVSNPYHNLSAVAIGLVRSSDTGRSDIDAITNDNTPTMDIDAWRTLPEGLEVLIDVTVDDVVVATIPYGPVDLTLDPLPDGEYYIGVAAYVPATGLRYGRPVKTRVTIDTVAPATPSGRMLAVSDTGRSDSDGITYRHSPHFDLKSDDGSYVTMITERIGLTSDSEIPYDPDTDDLVIPVIDKKQGNHSILSFDFPDGVYQATAQAIDLAGNASPWTEAYRFTIDTVAPAAPSVDLLPGSDSGFDDTDHITNDNTPSFAVGARLDTTIDLFVDGELFVQTGPTTADTTEITLGT